ncbi:hypothetical protein OIE43_41920 [Streptomyces pseudovenezuelae]|uniref:hypothetical protein n=1 Tax=Streptomyces pseudovenezuelae TaxID=67350 RepID=UPI002E3396B2|nr:hypothetical protein [Streptomyces pseudovenezuelae]WUA86065.1 hypothetical protein OHO81_01690 [Streptomyces pseudovenezuelae]
MAEKLERHDLRQRDQLALDGHRDDDFLTEVTVALDDALDAGEAALGLDGDDVGAVVEQAPDQTYGDVGRVDAGA